MSRLAPILEAKRAHVAARRHDPLPARVDAPRGFARALQAERGAGRLALIAEAKPASPSAGRLADGGYDPAALARAYAEGGASCLSVLTDAPFFGGDDAHLAAARAAVRLPALRKDFLVDPWQVHESHALGADCVLLIVAALDDDALGELSAEAGRLGLDVLVEVHDAAELERALALGATLLGINSRNLNTMEVDLAIVEELARHVPPGILLVAESGIRSPADARRLGDAGAHALLVGETLMRAADPAAAARGLVRAWPG